MVRDEVSPAPLSCTQPARWYQNSRDDLEVRFPGLIEKRDVVLIAEAWHPCESSRSADLKALGSPCDEPSGAQPATPLPGADRAISTSLDVGTDGLKLEVRVWPEG